MRYLVLERASGSYVNFAATGSAQALNLGISEAKYDLIARLDDDDLWLPGKIEKQLRRFAQDPDLTIIGTGMRQVFENGSPCWSIISALMGGRRFSGSSVRWGCPFPHGSIVARKDVFNLLGRYPQTAAVRHCEDYALWSVWVRFFKPGMIPEVLFDYTVSSGSVSSINAKQNQKISRKINGDFIKLEIDLVVPTAMAGSG